MKKLLLLLMTLLLSFSLMGCNQEETTESEPAASDTPSRHPNPPDWKVSNAASLI